MAADETGTSIFARADPVRRPEIRRLMIGRLQHLEAWGSPLPLVPANGWSGWRPSAACATSACAATSSRRCTAPSPSGADRGIGDYVIESGAAASPIIGRLVDKGLHDELTGEAYAVIDGTDGRAHHVRFRGIEAFEHAPPIGGIVEVRRFGGADDRAADAGAGQSLGLRPCQPR